MLVEFQSAGWSLKQRLDWSAILPKTIAVDRRNWRMGRPWKTLRNT